MRNLIYLLAIVLFSCSQKNSECNFPELKGEYLGQYQPEDSALLFAPNIVSTGMADRDIAIYPDGSEIYFCRNIGNFSFATIFYTKLINETWTKPQVLEFATNPEYIYIEPFISSDGLKFYFASNMPIEGTPEGIMNIWVADRTDSGWGKPYPIGEPINDNNDQYFPSITKNGTIYFTSEDPVTKQGSIYRSKFVDGKYQELEMLPENVNIGIARFNAFISPDEDFIVVPAFGLPDSYGATDYYIVFRNENDNWSKPINLGPKVNSANGQEWSASLSPDGKFLFYMSAKIPDDVIFPQQMTVNIFNDYNNKPQNGNSDIYWIKTEFIKDLKEKAIF